MVVSSVKKYSVRIADKAYTFVSDEPEEHILQSAAVVERYVKEIRSATNNMPLDEKTVILIALQLASRLVTLETKAQQQEMAAYEMLEKIANVL